MAKVLLLAPPYLDLYGKLSKAAGRYFPLGIAYIASFLRTYGNHDVRMYEPEAQNLTYADITEFIKTYSPDFVGITCSTPNFSRAIELAKICRKHSGAKIVLGGVHASAVPEFIIENFSAMIDYVVVGEGEKTMLELIDACMNNKHIEEVKGVVFRNGDRIVQTEHRPYIEDMDSIPYPARDLIPQNLFRPNLHNARYRNSLTILTSRGCPFNCSFCAARIVSGKKYRMHSAEYVLEEMQMLRKDYKARQLIITDDTFTLNHNRLEKICRGMINKKLNLEWFCFSQVNTVNREILKLMKRAGCFSIGFGVESSEKDILKKMGKNIRPEQAVETVREANNIGLKTQAFYVFGTPGETREQMENTISFSRKVGSTLAFFNMLVPYPGTKDFEHFFSSIPLEKIEWKNFVAIGEECVLSGDSDISPKGIERLLGKANVLYYTNPVRILNVLLQIRTFYEFSNYVAGGISFLKQIFKWFYSKPR